MTIVSVAPRSELAPTSVSPRRTFEEQHPDFILRVERASRRMMRLLGEVAAASTVRKRSDITRCYLGDKRVQLAFVWKALCKKRRFDLSPDDVLSIVDEMNLFRREDEPVLSRAHLPWGRSKRIIEVYGIRRFARQRMVGELIDALQPPLLNQYFKQGVPAALQAVEELVRAGFTHGAEIDVERFYPSVTSLDELKALLRPIPGPVVEHVVADGSLAGFARDNTLRSVVASRPNSRRRRGLPMGSASSPAAGEVIMRLLIRDNLDWPMVVYHDNVFVLGRSQQEVEASTNALREAAQRQTLGSLEFGPAKLWNYPETLTFLGQQVDPTEAVWRWSPSDKVINRYLWACGRARLTAEQFIEIIDGLPGFRRTYPLWLEGDQWCRTRRAELASRLFFLRGAPEDLELALTALSDAWADQEGQILSEDLIPALTGCESVARWRRLHEAFVSVLASQALR